jgi:hypothetical protein
VRLVQGRHLVRRVRGHLRVHCVHVSETCGRRQGCSRAPAAWRLLPGDARRGAAPGVRRGR